jgi:tRNA (mo5U34)-methyltransferase
VSDALDTHTEERLKERILELRPWHLDVQVTPRLSTRVSQEVPADAGSPESAEEGPVSFLSPRDSWAQLLTSIYPNGLEGRSFLDCACNCGGYCFWAKELGADRCFGFDVRSHWIRQADFLAEHRKWPSDGITFRELDLYDLPKLDLEPFDVVMFQGIFYHLPDPVTGLKIAADLTRELLILDTAFNNEHPDGMLVLRQESRTRVMSGVYGLNWFPTGPNVLTRILDWMGFVETRLISRRTTGQSRSEIGRLRMMASRTEGLLEGLEPADETQSA